MMQIAIAFITFIDSLVCLTVVYVCEVTNVNIRIWVNKTRNTFYRLQTFYLLYWGKYNTASVLLSDLVRKMP